MGKRLNDIPVDAIPEVAEFVDRNGMLEAFMESHKGIFETYRSLQAAAEQALEAADKTVRAQGVSCGPWERYQIRTTYNAEALYEALGRDGFLAIGGKLVTKTGYEVEGKRLETAIARGEIPKSVIDTVKKEVASYHAPKI
jgi:hypothetical protein